MPSDAASGRFRSWVSSTFLPPSPRLTGTQTWAGAAASLLFVLLSLPLLLHWRSAPSAGQSIWAEDGQIFLQQAVAIPWTAAVVEPYAGYMHLVPRTVMALVVLLPPEQWAAAIAVVCILIRSLLAVFVWHALAGHLPSRVARTLVGVAMVTIPLGGTEVLNNVANLHWFLLVASVPALLWRPAIWVGTVAQCVVVAAAMLSDPLALVWTPFVVVRLLGRVRWREQLVSAVFVAAAALQLSVTLGTSREPGPGMTAAEAAEAYVVRAAEPAFLGIRATEWAWQSARVPFIVATVVVICVILVGGLLRRGPHQGLIAACLGASVVFYVVAMGIGSPGGALLTEPEIRIDNMARYAAVAGLLLLTAMIAGFWSLLHLLPRLRPLVLVVSVLLIGTFAAGAVSGYGYRREAVSPVPWTDAVADGRQTCDTPGTSESRQPIDPGGGWALTIPCRYLR